MKTISRILAISLLFAVGCGDDDDDDDDDMTADAAVVIDAAADIDAGPPEAPVLGTQIDRAGRPAISTALVATFETDGTTQDNTKNAYNQDDDPTAWATNHAATIAGALAIYDSLDTICGNQLLAKPEVAKAIPADRYIPLAGVLAGDILWVRAGGASCNGTYLAVEAAATGALPNTDCGGRKLDTDVIKTSYSVLSGVGLGLAPADPDDGIAANDQTNSDTFPYIAAPQ